MGTDLALTKHTVTRRCVLAFSAAGAVTAALAACGEAAGVPTVAPTTAPAATTGAAPTAAAPAAATATATAVPQSLGAAATMAPAAATTAATRAASAAAAPTTAAAAPTMAAAVAPTVAPAMMAAAGAPTAIPAANLAATQTFRWADGPQPDGIDPAIITSPYLASQMFEGLIVVNPNNGMFEPGMAESYTANADATVFTFKMRPGVTWSDGTPITAKDFEYSFRRVMDPATKSKYTSALYGIKNGKEVETAKVPPTELGVKAVDDRTFEVTLTEPTTFFPLIAATWTCLPTPKQAIDTLKEKWTFGPNVVSNGPYVLREWKMDVGYTLERNERYWGPKPIITRVEQKTFEDVRKSSIGAYEANEIDQALLAAGDLARVRGDAKLSRELTPFPGSGTVFLLLDCTNKPTDDVRVRQALNLGFDRKTLIDTVLQGLFTDAPTMLPENIPGFNEKAAITGGVARAKELMAQAGFPDGRGFPAEFVIEHSTSTASTRKPMYEFLQAEWKKNLGIDVQIRAYDAASYSMRRQMRRMGMKFNAADGNWGSDYADPSNWHNQLFVSKSDYYGSHYKDEMFDSISAKAYATTNKDERVKLYEQAEQIFVQSGSHLTLYHSREFYLIKPDTKGIVHPPILGGTPWFKYIAKVKA